VKIGVDWQDSTDIPNGFLIFATSAGTQAGEELPAIPFLALGM
jgi:hypothetical protein